MRFGWTPEEYRSLTPAQRALLVKADEARTVEVTTYIRDAVANAVANAMRKKGQRAVPLWVRRKRPKAHKPMARGKALRKMRQIEAAQS